MQYGLKVVNIAHWQNETINLVIAFTFFVQDLIESYVKVNLNIFSNSKINRRAI